MAGGMSLTVIRGDGDRLSDQRGVRTIGCRGPLGRDDKAGLVCYANSSANLKALCHTLKYLILGCEYLLQYVHPSMGFFREF
jgi:hypothetical protein